MEVLLIDDNELILELQKAVLENCGLTVATASDGEDGIAMVRENEYGLILMDIQMPGLDGYQAAERIRRFNTETPIVALSADPISSSDERFVSSGLNGALRKPLETAAVQALLKRQRSASRTISHANGQTDLIFAYDELVSLLGEDDAVAQILGEFLTIHRDDCQELIRFIDAGDYLRAREIMHDIVGISGNLYCRRLFEAAKRLGAELRQQQADSLPLFVGVWEQTVDKLTQRYHKLLKAQSDMDEDEIDWPCLWQDFRTLSSEFDVRAVELFSRRSKRFAQHMPPEDFMRLRDATERYDFLWLEKHGGDLHVYGIAG